MTGQMHLKSYVLLVLSAIAFKVAGYFDGARVCDPQQREMVKML